MAIARQYYGPLKALKGTAHFQDLLPGQGAKGAAKVRLRRGGVLLGVPPQHYAIRAMLGGHSQAGVHVHWQKQGVPGVIVGPGKGAHAGRETRMLAEGACASLRRAASAVTPAM